MEKVIPSVVIEEAKTLIGLYGERIVLIGQNDVWDIYMFKFPDDLRTGYPYIFLYDREKKCTKKITGFKAVDIIGEFVKE